MTRAIAAIVVMVCVAAPIVAQRFDDLVRADFFAGYAGDEARLARGMDLCEKALAANPKDASALVWHGGGLFFQSGQVFRSGDWRRGLDMQERALREMNDAVALAPDDLQTLIPRGAILIASGPFLPDEALRTLLPIGIADWEKVERLQAPVAASQAAHSRGELLGGLANGYRLLGDRDKATAYLRKMVAELPGTPYAAKASTWLSNLGAVDRHDRFCLGCHR